MAVTIGTTDRCCLNLQQSLSNIAPGIEPDALVENFGMIDALRSPINTDGFEVVRTDAFPGRGRPGAAAHPKIEIEFELPECNSVSTSKIGLCWRTSAPSTYPERTDSLGYMEVTVAETRATGGYFTKDEFLTLCEYPNERLAKRIRKEARDLKRAINTRLIELAYPVMGNYADGVASTGGTAKTINLLNPDGFINPAAMAVIKSNYRRFNLPVSPILVGGDILGTWQDTRVMGGLGANAIQAEPNAFSAGVPYWIDFSVDSVIQGIEVDTNSHALAWPPGALQMVEWFDYVDYREELGKPDYAETTMVVDGITYDWSLRYDECEHAWSYELSKVFDLWYIPDAAYTPCWDFNLRTHWVMGCGAFDCTQYF